MHVEIVDYVAGAQAARGIAVVIDVFRAFSVAAYAFSRGAATILPVASIEEAREHKRQHPDWLLIGERQGRPLPDFDSGNSPAHLENLDLAGRTLIQTTSAGTQGLTRALQADEVLTGALVNAGAIVSYIRSRQPKIVTLVRMGQAALSRCDEDDLCAELIRCRLAGEPAPVEDIRATLRRADSAQRFFDPACDWEPARDFELCTQVDAFDFVLRLEAGPAPRLRRIDIPPQPSG